ncbi:HesA/MoeB/ThiF family protein [Candidatus Bipolaricaulota bacterium]|nr:HesA/MoeB/ThiF family protein [Candidatus Bipolaricaulota bacterium]
MRKPSSPKQPEDRYARQWQLPELGAEGHRRIRERGVVIVGCGALGSNSADLLVRSGIGRLTLVDADRLTENNLQRVAVYREEDTARPKAEALAEALRAINRDVEIRAVIDRIRESNARRLVLEGDILIDGLDNYASRYVVNGACVATGIPWVFGAVAGTFGMTMLIAPGTSACLHCLFPEPPDREHVLTAGNSGLIAPIPRIIAALQVATALRWITAPDSCQAGMLRFIDCWTASLSEQRVTRNLDCPTCKSF